VRRDATRQPSFVRTSESMFRPAVCTTNAAPLPGSAARSFTTSLVTDAVSPSTSMTALKPRCLPRSSRSRLATLSRIASRPLRLAPGYSNVPSSVKSRTHSSKRLSSRS